MKSKLGTTYPHLQNEEVISKWFFLHIVVIPSEARPKAELRSPEAELFSSLGNWVGNRKKVDKKKGTTTTTTSTTTMFFVPPPICFVNFKKSVSFWRKSQDFAIFVRQLFFLRKRKISGFCYFIKNSILAWIFCS